VQNASKNNPPITMQTSRAEKVHAVIAELARWRRRSRLHNSVSSASADKKLRIACRSVRFTSAIDDAGEPARQDVEHPGDTGQ
jgi:hypothetical protein